MTSHRTRTECAHNTSAQRSTVMDQQLRKRAVPTIRRRTPVKTVGDAGAKAVTTTHKLLTSSWTADVETLETAIGRFTRRRRLANDCQIVFFEIAGDGQLHVNVTHQD